VRGGTTGRRRTSPAKMTGSTLGISIVGVSPSVETAEAVASVRAAARSAAATAPGTEGPGIRIGGLTPAPVVRPLATKKAPPIIEAAATIDRRSAATFDRLMSFFTNPPGGPSLDRPFLNSHREERL